MSNAILSPESISAHIADLITDPFYYTDAERAQVIVEIDRYGREIAARFVLALIVNQDIEINKRKLNLSQVNQASFETMFVKLQNRKII